LKGVSHDLPPIKDALHGVKGTASRKAGHTGGDLIIDEGSSSGDNDLDD